MVGTPTFTGSHSPHPTIPVPFPTPTTLPHPTAFPHPHPHHLPYPFIVGRRDDGPVCSPRPVVRLVDLPHTFPHTHRLHCSHWDGPWLVRFQLTCWLDWFRTPTPGPLQLIGSQVPTPFPLPRLLLFFPTVFQDPTPHTPLTCLPHLLPAGPSSHAPPDPDPPLPLPGQGFWTDGPPGPYPSLPPSPLPPYY